MVIIYIYIYTVIYICNVYIPSRVLIHTRLPHTGGEHQLGEAVAQGDLHRAPREACSIWDF